MGIKKKNFIFRVLSIFLMSAFLAGLGYSQPREQLPSFALRAEISLINLLNGLDLTPAQTTLLLCRSLSASEFELQKNGLAEELVSLFKPELRFGDITKKIEAFLLSEEIIPLLRERRPG